MAAGWILHGGVAFCTALQSIPGLGHGFSTRLVGDMGEAADSRPEVRRRRDVLLGAAGLDRRLPADLRQVHGNRVVHMRDFRDSMEADGVVISQEDRTAQVPGIRTADCVPVVLADLRGSAAAVLHAGWRGTAAGIVRAAVKGLGLPPDRLAAALGPAAGACCYQVGEEVMRQVATAARCSPEQVCRSDHLDLRAALRLQLLQSGLPKSAVSIAPWCTVCSEDLFFSYRRDGAGAGRMMTVAAPYP